MTTEHIQQDLAGKTAVVTGSTSGIGLAIAKDFLARGASVMLNGSKSGKDREEFTNELASLIEQYGAARVGFKEANVDDEEQVKALMDAVSQKFGGKLDVLVNNAGIQIPKSIENITPAEFKRLTDIHLLGGFNCLHYALPLLEKGNDPCIINMSSVHGQVVSHERAPYCAAKFALEAMSRVAAVDLAPKGIRVNTVCPAFVDTPLARIQIDNMIKAGKTEQEAITWRLSNQGGEWITMQQVTDAVADIALGTKGIQTGTPVILDNDVYVNKANAQGGIAYFKDEPHAAIDNLNAQIEARAIAAGTPQAVIDANAGGMSYGKLTRFIEYASGRNRGASTTPALTTKAS